MGDGVINFEEHRRRRDGQADVVRCARCGKSIPATVTRCPECGVHFGGEAQDYVHPSERKRGSRAGWVVVAAAALLIAMVVNALGTW